MAEADQRAADQAIIDALVARDGFRTLVELDSGRVLDVYNIAWGYDVGDDYAHITTNISPSVGDCPVDFFFSSEVVAISVDQTQLLWPPSQAAR